MLLLLFAFLSLVQIGIVQPACTLEHATHLGECALKSASEGNYASVALCGLKFWNKCNLEAEPSSFDKADVVINANWSFLHELGTPGWTVKLSDDLKGECDVMEESDREQCLHDKMNVDGCYVAWTGLFNKGKTFLYNLISDRNFPTGFGIDGETKGLNFIIDEEVIHIDCPGATRAVPPDQLQSRFMTDQFVYDLLPDMANVVIFVVDILTASEQVVIDKLFRKIVAFAKPGLKKSLVIAHNFKSLHAIAEVEEHIQSDIIRAFNAKPKKRSNEKHVRYWTSMVPGIDNHQITHFVFAEKYSEAGKYYNPISKKWLNQMTNDMLCLPKKMNVLEYVMDRLTPLLRDYFHSSDVSDKNIVAPAPDPWQPLVRVARWVGDLVQYESTIEPQILNLVQPEGVDPYKLIFKPVVHPDYDGIMVLLQERRLILCDSLLGETPQCRPLPKCIEWKSDKYWAVQCTLPDIDLHQSTQDYKEKDYESKLLVLKGAQNSDKICEVTLFGTILPQWRHLVQGETETQFDLRHTDGLSHGLVHIPIRLNQQACVRWEQHHKIEYKNGVLTLSVKLKD